MVMRAVEASGAVPPGHIDPDPVIGIKSFTNDRPLPIPASPALGKMGLVELLDIAQRPLKGSLDILRRRADFFLQLQGTAIDRLIGKLVGNIDDRLVPALPNIREDASHGSAHRYVDVGHPVQLSQFGFVAAVFIRNAFQCFPPLCGYCFEPQYGSLTAKEKMQRTMAT
jgi:hypothetical protein